VTRDQQSNAPTLTAARPVTDGAGRAFASTAPVVALATRPNFRIRKDGVMSINKLLRSLQRASLALTVLMIAWGATVLHGQAVTPWFSTSATIWMVLLFASALWLLRGSFTALAAAGLTAAVVGRLFSTVKVGAPANGAGAGPSDLLLQVETGPGIPGYGYLGLLLGILLLAQFILLAVDAIRASKDEGELLIQTWALTFVRLCVGLMFVPHFAGHIFAGPHQFGIYTQYFAGLGLPFPAAQLVLAGAVEVIAAIGLSLGFCTRIIACLGAFYLFLTMLLGGHFSIGYVWILPDGGYEFGMFWAIITAVFILTGGGRVSVDNLIRRTQLFEHRPELRAARILFK
jgi:putative oxidoreductase